MTVTCVSYKSELTNVRNNMGLQKKILKIGKYDFFSACIISMGPDDAFLRRHCAW